MWVEIGHTCRAVGLRYGSQHPLDAFGDTRLVGRALQDGGLHARAGDAVLDVLDEHLDHDLGAVEERARSAEVEVVRHMVVRVQAGRRDDVDVRLGVDALDAGDVTTQTDDGQIDDRVDAGGLELVQPDDRVLDLRLFVQRGVVLVDLRAEDEHVLVHQHLPERARVDGALHGLDGRHGRCAPSVAGV